MEIYDRGYLTKEEKDTIDTQELIYLAVSNYTGEPVPEILPKYVYEYSLQKDGTILRYRYQNKEAKDDTDVLWDDFINARIPKNQFCVLFRPYIKDEYMDENGLIFQIFDKHPESIDLQMDFVGRNIPYEHLRPIYRNKAYFLTWVSDEEFLATLRKFGGEAV